MVVIHMISWIDKEYKQHYQDCANASGIRYKFYIYHDDFEESTIECIKKFVQFLRKKYYFPIRLNITFCNTLGFKDLNDGHIYYGAFRDNEDEKRMVYPRISVAAKVSENNTLEDIYFTLAHEITHYYQCFFLDEEQRTSRSLEREANKWANYIVYVYLYENDISEGV